MTSNPKMTPHLRVTDVISDEPPSKGDRCDFRFQIPDFRFQIPNSRFQISDFRFQISLPSFIAYPSQNEPIRSGASKRNMCKDSASKKLHKQVSDEKQISDFEG